MVPPDKKNFANQLSFTGHAVTDRALSAPYPRHQNQAKGAQALHPMGQAAGQNLALPEFTREINHLSGMMAEGMGLTSNLLQYKSLILFDAHSCYAGRAGVRPQRLALS